MSVAFTTAALPAAAGLAYACAAAFGGSQGEGRSRTAAHLAIGAWIMHGVAVLATIWGVGAGGGRFGFAPALAGAFWLVWLVHWVESGWSPLPPIRRLLSGLGALACGLLWAFPGEVALRSDMWLIPLHLSLGVATYGLFGAAVMHALLLDAADHRLRQPGSAPPEWLGMPLMRLERLTFRFVQAGLGVLSATLVLGVLTGILGHIPWRWDHKTVFSLLGWCAVVLLLWGRHQWGWRGRRATRWLYAGTLLLLLGYVGSRFVATVLLGRGMG